MSSFRCIITSFDVTLNNIDKWHGLLKIKAVSELSVSSKKILHRYGVDSIDEYYYLILNALENNTLD